MLHKKDHWLVLRRLRFDFSHNKPIEKDEMIKINKIVNDFVMDQVMFKLEL